MKDRNRDTVKLEISSQKINCNDLVRILYKHKIMSSVKSNVSVHCNKKLFRKCWIENGCSVSLHCVKPKQIKTLWKEIKETMGVTCCHIKVENKNKDEFNGCIHNFLDKDNPNKK